MSRQDSDSKSTAIEKPGRLPRKTAAVDDTDDVETPSPVLATVAELADERFAVTDEIARGGMGRVLAARDRRLDRTVAIKEVLGSSPQLRARFEREVQITAKLQHPAILPLYDAREWDSGEPYYVMRLVSGDPLSQKIADAESLDDRLSLLPRLQAAADALAFAHELGVIHRDVKPSNILVGEHGETVVIDWGIAKVIGDDSRASGGGEESASDPDATLPGAILGTPGYMAPEQAAGDEATERSDIYSLGATLYHLLSGRRPFEGIDSEKIMAAQLAGPPRPLFELERGIPGELLAIVDRALERDPEARYPNAGEFAEDLRRFQTGRLVAAHEYSLFERLWRFVRRHRAAVIVAVAAIAVVVVVVASSVRQIRVERDAAIAASKREAERADELLIVRARRLLEKGDPTRAAAMLKTLPEDSNASEIAWRVFAEAKRAGIRHRLDGPKSWASLEWHPTRPLLLVGGDREARLIDFTDRTNPKSRVLASFDDYVAAAAFVNGGASVAVGVKSKLVALISTETGNRTDLETNSVVVNLAVSGDGTRIAWRQADGSLWVRSAVGGAPERIGEVGPGWAIELDDDGDVIFCAGDRGSPATVWVDGERFAIADNAWSASLRADGAELHVITRDDAIAYSIGASEVTETKRWPLVDGMRVIRRPDNTVNVFQAGSSLLRLDPERVVNEDRVKLIYESTLGLIALTRDGLILADKANALIRLPDDHPMVNRVAAGHGLLATGNLGQIAVFRTDDIIGQSLQVKDASGVAFASNEIVIYSARNFERYSSATRRVEPIGKLEYGAVRVIASSEWVFSYNGPLSEIMRLRDGAKESIDVAVGLATFDSNGDLFFARGSKLLRHRPFSGEPHEVVLDAGAPLTHIQVRDGVPIIATTGEVIVRAGLGDQWRAELDEAIRNLSSFNDQRVVVSSGKELIEVTRGGSSVLAELPREPVMVVDYEDMIIATTLEHALKFDRRNRRLTVLNLGALRAVRLLRDPNQLVVHTASGNVLLVDMATERSEPLTSRLPFVNAIETDGEDRLAVLRIGGRIEVLQLAAGRGTDELKRALDEATPATIDTRTDELIWP